MLAAKWGGLGENGRFNLIIEFSRPVLTFDRQLDSHRRKKDRKNKHLVSRILRAVNEGGKGGNATVSITALDREYCEPREFVATLIRIDVKRARKPVVSSRFRAEAKEVVTMASPQVRCRY
jgi:hypothetical protein